MGKTIGKCFGNQYAKHYPMSTIFKKNQQQLQQQQQKVRDKERSLINK